MHEIIIAKELRYAHANNLFVSRLWEICIFIDFNTTLAFPARASVVAELRFRLQSQIQASINSIMVDNKAKQSPAFNCVSKKTFPKKGEKLLSGVFSLLRLHRDGRRYVVLSFLVYNTSTRHDN